MSLKRREFLAFTGSLPFIGILFSKEKVGDVQSITITTDCSVNMENWILGAIRIPQYNHTAIIQYDGYQECYSVSSAIYIDSPMCSGDSEIVRTKLIKWGKRLRWNSPQITIIKTTVKNRERSTSERYDVLKIEIVNGWTLYLHIIKKDQK